MPDPGDRRALRRQVAASVVRVVLVTTVLSLLYVAAPLGERVDLGVGVRLLLGIVLLAGVVTVEVLGIARSTYPVLRAVEAVAVLLPLIVLPFAGAYYVASQQDAATFSEPLSRLDALYFTVTTLATVGFGDIVPKTEAARALVLVQMLVNLVLIGAVARLLFGTAQRARQRREDDRREGPHGDHD